MAGFKLSKKMASFLTVVAVCVVVFAMHGVRFYWEAPPATADAATLSKEKGLSLSLQEGGGAHEKGERKDTFSAFSDDVVNQNGLVVDGQTAVVVEKDVVPKSISKRKGDDKNMPDDLSVQAVLTSAHSAVVSGGMDGVISEMPFENGDTFKKGDILVRYECLLENARVDEALSRTRISKRQMEALERLRKSDTASEIEFISARENYKQNKAQLDQALALQNKCTIRAPFDGRVTDKQASAFEASKSGRVLMQIGSLASLQAELLIPSHWLRWVNVGTPVTLFVSESERNYGAEIIRIYGDVDPVSRTAHVVARINDYQEELLPGMSGRATLNKMDLDVSFGFLGLKLGGDG